MSSRYRSKREVEQRRRRNLLGFGAVAAAGVLAFGLLIVFSAGGSKSESDQSGFVVLDVSKSTRDVRGLYTEDFNRFATEIANDGSGEVRVMLAAADPQSEAPLTTHPLAPLPINADKPRGPEEIEENVAKATAEVAAMLEDPPVEERGSGLVEAANVIARQVNPGDRVLYLTDGLQWTRSVGHLIQMDLSEAGIKHLLTELKAKSLLPRLDGVEVEFPRMLLHPEGLYDAAQEARIPIFWERWAEATGASLTYELSEP